MLKSKLQHFYDLVEKARQRVGDNAPKITDAVLEEAFPRSMREAEVEGCEAFLRNGVKEAVVKYIRKPKSDERQRTFNDIAEDVMPLVEKLPSAAYFDPAAGDDGSGAYVSVPDLCFDLPSLNRARKFMRQKGMEVLAEADRLDELYAYLCERG